MLMGVLNRPVHYSVLLSGENRFTSRVGTGLYSREKWLALLNPSSRVSYVKWGRPFPHVTWLRTQSPLVQLVPIILVPIIKYNILQVTSQALIPFSHTLFLQECELTKMYTRQSRLLSYALGELLWSLLQLSFWILALGKHKSPQQYDIKEFRHNQSLSIKCSVSS